MKKKRNYFWIFWAFMFVGAFLVLTQTGYSDGDDAYFYQYTHAMKLPEYLCWRYETWVGRMTAETLVYITFNLGLWFWRVVNAGMLVLIPLGLLRLAGIVAGMPWSSIRENMVSSMAAVSGYLWMGALTLGYAAVWVNGSIFYTWTFACGIWAMVPLAELVFTGKETEQKQIEMEFGSVPARMFFYSIPCAVIATMSIEQMGAVLLTFEVIGVLYCLIKYRRVNVLLLMQTFLTCAAFVALFAAPGNDIRVATEIETWMPEFATMSLGQHMFITVQWLLSSFANENKLFLGGIWFVGCMLLRQQGRRDRTEKVLKGAAAGFSIGILFSYFHIPFFSDLGIGGLDVTSRIERVPAPADLTYVQIFAMVFWTAALLFTVIFLWNVLSPWKVVLPGEEVVSQQAVFSQDATDSREGMFYRNASVGRYTILLAYLAGIASEAIMFFSPTMYASGARVYYLTDLLYLFIILAMTFGLEKERQRRTCLLMICVGILNFIVQIPNFLAQL